MWQTFPLTSYFNRAAIFKTCSIRDFHPLKNRLFFEKSPRTSPTKLTNHTYSRVASVLSASDFLAFFNIGCIRYLTVGDPPLIEGLATSSFSQPIATSSSQASSTSFAVESPLHPLR